MNSIQRFGGGLALALGLLVPPASAAKPARVFVCNPLRLARTEEVASLLWSQIRRLMPGLDPGRVAIRDLKTRKRVPTQIYDADGDGRPEELLFLVSLGPRERRRYQVEEGSSPILENLLQARHVPERKDDFAWENDRGAYRLYGPALAVEGSRGGVDVWSKRTRRPVVDRWYQGGVYHEDQGEGCDAYKVGASLGCGGTGYLDAAGKLVVSPVWATQQLICAGPLRLTFVLSYPPLEIGKARITETRRITLDRGASLFQVEARFSVEGETSGIRPVAGIRTDAAPAPELRENLALAWVEAEGGQGKHGLIGEALVLSRGLKVEHLQGHALGVLARDLGQPVGWWAGATWSKGLEEATPQAWRKRIHRAEPCLWAPLKAEPLEGP
jgi:unsaturated rhamnogalacturonyl hydrolase